MYRTSKNKMKKQLTVGAAVALSAMGVGSVAANAATHTSTSHAATAKTSAPTTGAPVGDNDGDGPAGAGQHLGGTVTAVTATSLTVTNPQGNSTTYAFNSSTTFTKDDVAATAAAVTVGSHVDITVSATDATTATAVDVDTAPQGPPAFGGQRQEPAGGQVTGISATSITVKSLSGTSTTYTINSSTTVTKFRAAGTLADLTTVELVRIDVSSTDATVASRIDIVPAMIAGKVTAVSGNTITVTGFNNQSATITVSSTTTYSKAGASASLADVTVGSFIAAEGSFGSSKATLTATSIGIGQPQGSPGFGGPGFGGPDHGGPGFPGDRGPANH